MSSQFKKGQSGNPGGRPTVAPEVKELAKKNAPAAMEKLVALMGSADERISLAASNAVLDRAWGRPTQALEHTTPDDEALSFEVIFVKPDEG